MSSSLLVGSWRGRAGRLGQTGRIDSVRIDQWLWAARCFKTRSKASAACKAGHVAIDGETVKPSKAVRPGAFVRVLTPGGLRILEVAALGSRRVSATLAQELYVDHTPPPEPRTEPAIQRERGTGRPTKRDRRRLEDLWRD